MGARGAYGYPSAVAVAVYPLLQIYGSFIR